MDAARTKRLVLIEVLIFFTLVANTALLFRPFMAVINKNIYAVRDTLIGGVEEVLHRPIRYASTRPSIIGSVEIRDITVGEDPDPLLSVDWLYVEYSLLDLILGRGMASIRQVILTGPAISYDLERDKDLAALFSGTPGGGRKFRLSPDCGFHVEDGRIQIKGPSAVLGIGGFLLDGTIQKGLVNVTGQWHKPAFAGSGGVPELSLDGEISGAFSDDFKDGDVQVRINSFEGDGFLVKNLGLGIFFKEDGIEALQNGELPLFFNARYTPGRGEFSGSVSLEKLVLEDAVTLSGPLEGFRKALDLKLSGKGAFTFRSRQDRDLRPAGFVTPVSRLDYDFNLTGEYPPESRGDSFPVRGFILEGTGNGGGLFISRCRFDFDRGSVGYQGDVIFRSLEPQGTLTFNGFSLTGDGSLNGVLSFSRTGQGIRVSAPSFFVGRTLLSGLSGNLTRQEGENAWDLRFSHFTGAGEGGVFSIQGSFAPGNLAGGSPGRMNGSLLLRNFALAGVIDMARPFVSLGAKTGNWAEKTFLGAEVIFTTDFRGLSYTAPRVQARYGENALAFASLSGTHRRVETSGGRLEWPGGGADFSLGADFSQIGDISFNSRLFYHGQAYTFQGNLLEQRNLVIRGSHGLVVNVQIPERGALTARASLNAFPLPYRDRWAYLDFESVLRYGGPSSWDMDLQRLVIRDPGAYSVPAVLTVHGQANQNGLNLDTVSYEDRYGKLEGTAAALWEGNFSLIDASLVLDNDKEGKEAERLAADLFYDQGMMEFHGILLGFQADRLADSGTGSLISAEMYGLWNGDYYSASLSLDSLRGRYREQPYSLSAKALLYPERFIVSQIYGTLGETEAMIPSFSVDRAAGRMDTEGRVYGRVKGHDMGLTLSLGVNFQPIETWRDLKTAAGSFSGIMEVRNTFINERERQEPFSFIFTRTSPEANLPGFIRVSGGPENMFRLEMEEDPAGKTAERTFTVSLSAPSPVQGTIAGALEGSVIDAWASDVYVDLPGLWDVIPIDKEVVDFTGGFITGETRVYGSLFDPEFAGSAWGSGITIVVPEYVGAEIGPGTGTAALEGNEISFGPILAACGEGSGVLNGWVSFNRWIPSFYLDIVSDKAIPADFDISGVKAKGSVSGHMELLLENKEVLTITGNLDVSDTEITVNAAEMERAREGRDREGKVEVVVDLQVNAGRRVEFIWPDPKTSLIRAYGDAGSSLRIEGDTRIPQLSLDGNILFRGGELYYLQRSFYIREGQIVFNGNDPEIDPRISARAEIQDRNDDGPVTIALVVDNMPLSSFLTGMPRLESTPSLSQQEIYSILGQAPSLSTETDASNLNPLINASIEMLLQRILFRGAERQIRNILKLDMLSFRTQILQNALWGTTPNQGSETSLEAGQGQSNSAGNYLDNTAVYMGKYLGLNIFVESMVSFRYDQYRREYGGLRLEPEIGLNFRTPLADIRWNVMPQRLENLFVSDQSISLVWRWSF
ncbi:MAG: translocation/assembly module TamB domain-containing protein [Treponema sp.]|nr:translocation/assembly module TamB domain-containing protein [Treponema sp.]